MKLRSSFTRLSVFSTAAIILAGSFISAPDAGAVEIFGLVALDSLVSFDSATPGTVSTPIAITGIGAGEVLQAIDFRPATGELYALATDSDDTRLYVINTTTGVATPIGAGPTTVTGISGATDFDIDFNPSVDRIRVITDLASDGIGGNVNNFRLNPDDGSLVGGAPDLDLDYAAVPGAFPEAAIAYTNNFDNINGDTALFGIATGNDTLLQNTVAPDLATLIQVGPLGVNATGAGFDISGPNNDAYAAISSGILTGLFNINLDTGAATSLGSINAFVFDISVPITVSTVQFSATSFTVNENDGNAVVTVTCTNCFDGTTVDFATSDASAVAGVDYTATAGTLTFALGETSKNISIPIFDLDGFQEDRTFNVTLSNPNNAAALGTPSTTAVTIIDNDSSGGCSLVRRK